MLYITRNIEKEIIESSKEFPCIAIYGPRQVGKTTTVKHLFKEQINYVTLDSIADRDLAINSPTLFLERYGFPLIIGEIQKAPSLLDEIKINVDRKKEEWLKNNQNNSLMYILTGSNRFELEEGISESLAGRCVIIEMYSLSNLEKEKSNDGLLEFDYESLLKRESITKLKYKTQKDIFNSIFTGGMPEIYTKNINRKRYFDAYLNTYIEKDIKKLISVSNETTFLNFLSLVALRTGQELHYESLSSSIGIDVKTCKKWISILQSSGIVCLLQPYMANISNRIIKAPKLYFMDTGLCAYLCGWPNSEILSNSAMSGAFFETYIVSEIIKNFVSYGRDYKRSLYYYRDRDQKEIDILYVDYKGITPIEIKKSIVPIKPTKNFSVLNKYNMPINNGIVIDMCDKIRPINDNAFYLPAYLI